jgi:hypothetical protein
MLTTVHHVELLSSTGTIGSMNTVKVLICEQARYLLYRESTCNNVLPIISGKIIERIWSSTA